MRHLLIPSLERIANTYADEVRRGAVKALDYCRGAVRCGEAYDDTLTAADSLLFAGGAAARRDAKILRAAAAHMSAQRSQGDMRLFRERMEALRLPGWGHAA